jgi:D-alanine--poly(phosphoribitol) ligase subunit 2
MPLENAIESGIAELFRDSLRLEIPSPDTDLFATGALDSMGFVELLARLEERFGITISLEEIEIDRFRTIRDIAGFVRDGRAETRGAAALGAARRP